ncbi:hypothetical protein STSP2_02204 [Anaerohalosphaera lusitana]|uniref:Uncharacterized protein n=1 Tax=Anaerohalosphaera lusitana TaxID=1936003 RepID=A0A1U9NMG3_9BACT|nr:hypothetical protein [Anaerohalosphaera lusitana]AQT69025.1 hypothetical protein STSP2_02204 [Anaerohalosphaera lusitana]
MKTNNENLKTLLNRFYDDASASQIEREIADGDELMSRFTSPHPSGQAVNNVKDLLGAELSGRRKRRYAFRVAGSVAAVLLIAISILFTTDTLNTRVEPEQSSSVYAFDSKSLDESELYAEFEEIEESFVQVRTGGWDASESDDLDELESEFDEIAGNFWKG